MLTEKNPESRVFFLGEEKSVVAHLCPDVAIRFARFRHDLQNDLQLVYGFLQLQKPTSDILLKLDKITDRVRTASLVFNLESPTLSCAVFDIWSLAESSGLKLRFQATGDWKYFGEKWPACELSLATLWAHYQGLATDLGVAEVALELSVQSGNWHMKFSGAGTELLACFVAGHGEVAVDVY